MPAKTIRVTADVWGGGPGMEGTSYLEFKLDGPKYDVFAGGTALDGREKLGEVLLLDGWRGRISYIVEKSPPYHEEKSPDEIIVRGAKGSEALLMAAAWSGESGTHFVSLVLKLDDVQIEELIEQTQHSIASAIDTVAYASFEVGSDDTEILQEICNMLVSNSVDWDELRLTLDAKAAAESAKLDLEIETQRRLREIALRPHQEKLETTIKSWVNYEERSGRTAGPGLTADLKKSLEDYVVRENKFPVGLFEFEIWYKTSMNGRPVTRVIEVDLDIIKPY